MSRYDDLTNDPKLIDMLSTIQSHVGLEDGENGVAQKFTDLRIRLPPQEASKYADKLESYMNQLEVSSDAFTPYFRVAIRRLRM